MDRDFLRTGWMGFYEREASGMRSPSSGVLVMVTALEAAELSWY